MRYRTASFVGALALALAPATAALAKPVSTYSVTIDWNSVYSASISLTENGSGSFSLANNTFDLVTCADGSVGLVTNIWTANDSPAAVTLTTDRKMTQATATATGVADVERYDSCTQTTSYDNQQITLVFDATAAGVPPGTDVDVSDAEFMDGADMLKEGESPDAVLARDELSRAIDEAISELPDDLRSAVTLREFDGLSYEQIAEIMDCPVGTVRSRIFRARESIDRHIAPLIDRRAQSR